VLHLRVISPPGHTDAVRELLLAEPGATHVTALPGIALQPAGDVVEADVTREAVDAVLAALRRLGVDRTSGVTLGRSTPRSPTRPTPPKRPSPATRTTP